MLLAEPGRRGLSGLEGELGLSLALVSFPSEGNSIRGANTAVVCGNGNRVAIML